MLLLLFAQCAPASTSKQNSGVEVSVSIKMMTSLPIIWGEGGSMQAILSGDAEPAPIYKYWRDRYEMEAVDSLEGLGSSETDIVMLVQPRAMAPADLADLDDWIRKGGDAIIMTDPDLLWPSAFPLGDPQRPLSSGLLSPLLKHWGLELVSQNKPATAVELEYADHKIATIGIGGFEVLELDTANEVACKFSETGFIAQCQIGAGRVILVADADFLHEQLWTNDNQWQESGESDAMRFVDTLIDQFNNVSKD
jgi:hypothetical protein